MTKLQNILQKRLKATTPTAKVTALATASSRGERSSFEGVFSSEQLTPEEASSLQALLDKYKTRGASLDEDYTLLSQLAQEVKAITKQAILLHGERIARAQVILKRYKEGAFSAWLTQTYGNRQTPYNLLQYYTLWSQLTEGERALMELMPRQAIYSLASRDASIQEKLLFIKNYKGQSKQQLLEMIRHEFPLNTQDRRQSAHAVLRSSRALLKTLSDPKMLPISQAQARESLALILQVQRLLTKLAKIPS